MVEGSDCCAEIKPFNLTHSQTGGCYRKGTIKGISEKVMFELKHVRKAAM